MCQRTRVEIVSRRRAEFHEVKSDDDLERVILRDALCTPSKSHNLFSVTTLIEAEFFSFAERSDLGLEDRTIVSTELGNNMFMWITVSNHPLDANSITITKGNST